MQTPAIENGIALGHLVMAELAEGKGRFMDQIINGVWLACGRESWVFSAHLPGFQTRGRVLPDPEEVRVDHAVTDLGSLLSWTWYFLKDEMDKKQTNEGKL